MEEAVDLRSNFRKFVRKAWPIVEPAKELIDNWHIDAIADHLQAVADGQIRWLMINIGPGYAKSILASVCFSAWMWARNPLVRILCSTYATSLTVRDNIKTRNLLESEWFQKTFVETLPDARRWKFVKRNEDHLENDKMGFRLALSVEGTGTGLRGDGQILDDLMNAKEAYSAASRLTARRYVFETMSSRFNDMRTGWRVAIGQRLHHDDPYGAMLETGMYEHLCLPSEFEPERRAVTTIGFTDPRKEHGELLFPELFTREVIDQAKKDLGEYGFAGQHQQRPSPAGGGVWKRHWFRYWQPQGAALPPVRVMLPDGNATEIEAVHLPDLQERAQSWDMAFKRTNDTDFVVGQVWGRRGADRFFLDQVRERMNFAETVAAVRKLTRRHPGATAKLVEDKANGPAVVSLLKQEISGLIEVQPEGGKEARAQAVSPVIEAGNVYLPHPTLAPWVDGFLQECMDFPGGKNDDQVDACSQMLTRWLRNVGEPKPLAKTILNPGYGSAVINRDMGGPRDWML